MSAVRRRPKDRKDQIARAAAAAFSESGYHAVRMESIAAEVGITATALYRHFPSKYALFRAGVLDLVRQLVDATAADDERRLVDALIDVTLANRAAGGLYRWQARYLKPADHAELVDEMRRVHRNIQGPLERLRPGLDWWQQLTLSSALLSVVGSIVDHRVRLPTDQIHAVLAGAAFRVLSTDLPAHGEPLARPRGRRMFSGADTGTYEALLQAAMALFNRLGYRETSMEQIAAAVGVPVSGIYRYFPAKSDILATAMRRAADWVSGELSAAVSPTVESGSAPAGDPRQVLTDLVRAYVATSFANPELAFVYHTERVNLVQADRTLLRNVQRSTVDSWVRLLTSVRPSLGDGPARLLVHAAMALVIDIGELVHYDDSPHSQACVRHLIDITLFGS